MKGSQLSLDQSEWVFKIKEIEIIHAYFLIQNHMEKTSVLSNWSKDCHFKEAYLILWRTDKNWAHLYLMGFFLKVKNNLEAKK